MFVYTASLINVVDGDTLDIEVDLGFKICYRTRVRLYGIDTPEIYGVKKESEEYNKGLEASKYVNEWFSSLEENKFIVESIKDKQGKYGRYLVKILSMDKTRNLNEDLVNNGHADVVIYD